MSVQCAARFGELARVAVPQLLLLVVHELLASMSNARAVSLNSALVNLKTECIILHFY